MLIAPAGFGKTTLAEQWTSQPDREAVWYRVRDAAVDVAVLGVGLADATSTVVPGSARRIRERTIASSNPSDESALLAGMLAEDLQEWPASTWLVLDDYHALCAAPEAELFVETLAGSAPLNLLITSRCRPSWVSSRSILYGEILEVGQTALAMTREEAQEVLEGWRAEQATGLIALADGWPAVIGLAGILPLPSDPRGEVPEALYEYFADEVFQALEPDVRAGLSVLAIAPTLDRELARIILDEHADEVVEEGLRTGILEERNGVLELHPLARNFLNANPIVNRAPQRRECIERCLAVYRDRRDWDALFHLVKAHKLTVELQTLLSDGLDELLDAARLATLEHWVEHAERHGSASPALQVARAELALRKGEHLTARTLASAAARSDRPEIAFRALLVAAGAAHVAGDEQEALELFENARERAPTKELARRAEWNRLMCLTELEMDQAESVLRTLASGVPHDDPRELVLEAGRRLGVELKFGSLRSLKRARLAAQLVPFVADVLVRTSFRSVLATALNTAAEYAEALKVAQEMSGDADEHKLGFALPYAHTASAAALAGLRDYTGAEQALQSARSQAVATNNDHALLNAFAQQVRVLCQMGRTVEACRLPVPTEPIKHAALRAELQASRALAMACAGRLDEALHTLGTVRGTTRCIEARVLVPATEAVVLLKRRRTGNRSAVETLLEATFDSCGLDLLVTAYRACPELLAILVHDADLRGRCWQAILQAGDTTLVEDAGVLDSTSSSAPALSKREKEIYELVCSGLTNRQIADLLFISERTVKVHVQHIFDKTGIRSRRALALGASRDRLRQAAPTATSSSDPAPTNRDSTSAS